MVMPLLVMFSLITHEREMSGDNPPGPYASSRMIIEQEFG
jgi:hypothetical protein